MNVVISKSAILTDEILPSTSGTGCDFSLDVKHSTRGTKIVETGIGQNIPHSQSILESPASSLSSHP